MPVAQFWKLFIGVKTQREEVYFPGSGLFISPTLELESPAIEQIQASWSSMCLVFCVLLINASLLPSATNIHGHPDGPLALALL